MATDFKALWRAKADGKEIQAISTAPTAAGVKNEWVTMTQATTTAMCAEFFLGEESAWRFRIKPETITVNGHEVPAPLSQRLPPGQDHWLVAIARQDAKAICVDHTADAYFDCWLARGLLHATEEGARKHAEALLSWSKSTK